MPANFAGGVIAWITSPENPEGVYASDYSTWELNVSTFYSELLIANK
jgi:hypothetical protein